MATIDYKQKIKDYMNSSEVDTLYKSMLNNLFPELKESEDESIRKWIKNELESIYVTDNIVNNVMADKALAWLEKQGEQKYVPKYKIGDYVKNTNYKGEPIYEIVYMDKECYICEYRGKENMGDKAVMHFSFDNPYLRLVQKPADKDEPKFKAGDWIYHEISGNTFHINRIENRTYISDEGATISFGRQKDWRLWIIQDAKDGDVLADGVGVILFRKIGNKKDANVVDYHCAVFKSGSFIIQKGVSYWGYSNDEQLRPATKEQCERFFATMRDVGYEWDADKKGLKKLREE